MLVHSCYVKTYTITFLRRHTDTHIQRYRKRHIDRCWDIYKETHTFGQTHRDTNKQNTKTNVSVLRLDASILSTYRPTECEKDLQNSNCYIKKKA